MAGQSERKPFLLRLDPATLAALKAWAADDLRSLNGQIEYLLRRALRDAGRLPGKTHRARTDSDAEPDGSIEPGPADPEPVRATPAREPADTATRTR